MKRDGFFDVIIVNDNLDEAYDKLKNIVLGGILPFQYLLQLYNYTQLSLTQFDGRYILIRERNTCSPSFFEPCLFQ